MNSESEIILELKAGSKEAFKKVYQRFYPRILGYCVKNGQSEDDAKEVVQDVFVKIWEKRESLKIDRNLDAFVFSIAKNLIIDKFRWLARKEAAEGYQFYFLQPTNVTEESLDYQELQDEIKKTLDSMPDIRRLVFQMSRFKGYSNHEIATELGISVRTVENHISKALKSFRNDLKHYSAMMIALISLHSNF